MVNVKRNRKLVLGFVTLGLGAFAAACGEQNMQASNVDIIGGQPVANNQADNRRWSTVAITTDYATDKAKPSLLSAGHSFCSGTLVAENIVVTAAHCLQKFDPDTKQKKDELILPRATDFVVSFATEVNDGSEWVRAAKVIPHVDWDIDQTLSPNPTSPPNDLGVIVLEQAAPATAQPAQIADLGVEPSPNGQIDLVGFGITQSRDQNDTGIMRQVTTTFKTIDATSQRFQVGAFFKGACAGDSGGPAYHQVDGEYLLMGATSTGAEFNGYCLGVMANYTDVRYYKDWILSH